jgi:hypothetical protein
MRVKIVGILYPSACTHEMPDFDDTELKKLDHRPYFSHEEKDVFGKPIKILGELNGVLIIEGRLRIYRYKPKPEGEKETGLIIFRGVRGDAEFYILPEDEKDKPVTFVGLKRAFFI